MSSTASATTGERPRLILSLLSLVFWPLISVKLAARIARWAGYDGIQFGPTRGIPLNNTSRYIESVHRICPIRWLEGVWSLDNWDVTQRIVFNNPDVAARRFDALKKIEGARLIAHDFNGGDALEAHPGLWLRPDEVLARATETGQTLCPDTYHLRRPTYFDHELANRPKTVNPEDNLARWNAWQVYLGAMAKRATVVHIQPHRDHPELQRWLDGLWPELSQIISTIMAESCQDGRWPDFVIELAPPNGRNRKIIWLLTLPALMLYLPWLVRKARRRLQLELETRVEYQNSLSRRPAAS